MCRLLLITIAFLMVVFGIGGLLMMPKILQQKIEQRMQLKIGTKAFKRFEKVPIPLTVKFYLFNVTNSERVLQGDLPKFQEVGPFMYKQWRRREIVDFEDNNRKMKYKEIKTYYPFAPTALHEQQNFGNSSSEIVHNNNNNNNNNNNIPLDPHKTNVTLINVPLLAILTKVATLQPDSLLRGLVTRILSRLIVESGEKILINRRASQFLFDGYKVGLLESLSELVSQVTNSDFPSPLPGNTFGFFYGRNDTWNKQNNGEQTIFTGRNNSMKDFMLIESWNDERELKVWPTDTVAGGRCNEIRGTDGSQFHPGTSRDQILDIFNPLICSSIQIKYKEDTSARGIPLLRFTPYQTFSAPMKSKNHACYCTVPPKSKIANKSGGMNVISDDRCYRDGIIDLSLCQKGAPLAGSFPHFYQGDSLLSTAAGLKPNQAIHETFVDIEPMTGTVMRAAARAQVNVFVEKPVMDVIDRNLIGNLTPMVAPTLWVEEYAEIDEPSADEFKLKLLSTVQRVHRAFIYSIIIGIIIALLVSIQYWYVTCYSISLDRPANKNRFKQRPNKRRSQLQSNLRLATSTGSRQLRSSKGLADMVCTEIDADEGPMNSLSIRPVIATAVALGAASAGPATRRGIARSRKSRASNVDPHEDEDDELNKKLMINEWNVGQASNTSSSVTSQSCQGGSEIRGENPEAANPSDEDESSSDYLDDKDEKKV